MHIIVTWSCIADPVSCLGQHRASNFSLYKAPSSRLSPLGLRGGEAI